VAASRLRINGLPELRAQLQQLPVALTREGAVIVEVQAEAALREMTAAYPRKSGNLRGNLRMAVTSTGASTSARVTNRAKHAYIFEQGTKARQWSSGKSTGVMPAGRVFIPIAQQRRRILLAALIDLVETHGLHVTGAAG